MSAQHTPEPWHDDGYRIYAPTDSDDKRDGRVIVEYKHVADFNPADARLIAAAPMLLEALHVYVYTIAAGGGGDRDLFMAAIREADKKARAAISAATGGQS